MSAIIIGLGQMGGAFAHGLLRQGETVVPVTRGTKLEEVAQAHPEPSVVLIAVGEGDLAGVLKSLPSSWCDRAALLQNELDPSQYEALQAPTLATVWFEKKKGTAIRPIVPSVLSGPRAELLAGALGELGLESSVVSSQEMLWALGIKNLYILTANIAGLVTGGTVGQLFASRRDVVEPVFDEVLAIQTKLLGVELDKARAQRELVATFDADPEHKCTGRSAPARLARAIGNAERLGIDVPALRAIAAEV